jgi:serine O-acetyltransferase
MNVVEQEVWAELRRAAIEESEREPVLSGHLYDLVIRHPGYPEALAYLIAASLGNHVFNVVAMSDLTSDTIRRNPEIVTSSLYDLNAVLARDPACEAALVPFLYYKGFKGLQGYRVAHALWTVGRFGVARFLQSRIAEVFAMDIHPAARIGRGVFIDHGTGIVIGETSVVEDDVFVATGSTVCKGVTIGRGSIVSTGSVVTRNVPPYTVVAGNPARVVFRLPRPADQPPA